jgi:hypothetical protein
MRMAGLSLSFVYGDKNNPEISKKIQIHVCESIGTSIDFGPCVMLGIVLNGNLLGGVIFHDYIKERGTIEITIGAKRSRWLTRKVINEIARMGFVANDCHLIFARCDAGNKTTTKILHDGLKFKKILLPHMRGDGKHEILFFMTRKAWQKSRFFK